MDLPCLKKAVPFSAKHNFHSHFWMQNLLESAAAVKTAEVSVIEGRIFFFAFFHANREKGVA